MHKYKEAAVWIQTAASFICTFYNIYYIQINLSFQELQEWFSQHNLHLQDILP